MCLPLDSHYLWDDSNTRLYGLGDFLRQVVAAEKFAPFPFGLSGDQLLRGDVLDEGTGLLQSFLVLCICEVPDTLVILGLPQIDDPDSGP